MAPRDEDNPTVGDGVVELTDPELADSATTSADVLRAIARRWRFRMQAGRLGAHPSSETSELVRRLERAAELVEGTTAAPRPAPAAVLDENADRFRFLIDSVTDYAIFMLDPDGNIASWNVGAERIMGYRAEEVLGRHFSQFYPPEERDGGKPRAELETAARDGRYIEEGWRVRRNGARFFAHVTLTAVRDAHGRLRGYAKVTRDVTDVRQANEALRQSEERFRLLVAGVRDYAIFLLDKTGRVSTWNAGAERIKQYKAQEIIGRHFSVFYPQAERDRGHPAWELERATADGAYSEEGWRIRKDGTSFWASVVITALKDDRGELVGFAKVTRDMTERRAMEEKARKAAEDAAAQRVRAEEAQNAVRARDEFITIAGHELRTPLTAVQLKVEGVRAALTHGVTETDKLLRRLDDARDQIQRFGVLVERLLDVSRVVRGTLVLQRADVDLTALTKRVVDELADTARHSGCEVRLDAPEAVTCACDGARIEQVLVNLLSNALKYGAGKPVDLRLQRTGDDVTIVVQDRGIGVPPDAVERIFERFERAVSVHNYGGLGLGLYIARNIVEAHGGTIGVKSTPGEGATFIVALPRTVPASEVP